MAVAEKRVERRVIEDVTVILKLSEDEARTVAAVLSLVSGDRRKSPREHTVAVLNALREARVLRSIGSPFEATLTTPEIGHPVHLAEGMVRFRDYPEGA
ncbi:hypothetical protein ACFVYV_09450 [Streptomyces mirabilis]|uniref:hypothetical protein n=1 Tax=Streptomyces mirabilis TaxID=68239 RepID=UPI0036DA5F6A